MDITTFLNINKIIARDSKSTTYKFALLRGVIEKNPKPDSSFQWNKLVHPNQ